MLRRQPDEAKRKKKLKRTRAESEAEVEAELEKEERTGESVMFDRQIMWRTKARQTCRECWKRERKCLWPDLEYRFMYLPETKDKNIFRFHLGEII